MSTKERLLSIHILNKLTAHPDYACTLGIEILPPLSCSGKTTQTSERTSSPESTCV